MIPCAHLLVLFFFGGGVFFYSLEHEHPKIKQPILDTDGWVFSNGYNLVDY